MIRLTNIKVPVKDISSLDDEQSFLLRAVTSKLRLEAKDISDLRIHKKSIDARKKDNILFVYTVDISAKNKSALLKKKGVNMTPDMAYRGVGSGEEKLEHRPLIVGLGPAGLFAALILARRGYRPIVLERGEDVDKRAKSIGDFWSGGALNVESNVQFGEGGAGTFSDGKLTTLINDKRCRLILEEFIKAGGPKVILYSSKPHLGTDHLKKVVKNIRQEIIAQGGEVCFSTQVTDFFIEDGKVKAVEINGHERLECDMAVLAIGHSARDTFQMLYRRDIPMKQKPFSIGLR
ncbi:MAG TPA: NAD(P)/FAD-dependent oxidoreductase, partial [Bacillota bacterium]|nr:NAD(P)/FAD-dependent oxidoreductase [Bacillota bacterium]